MTMAYSKIEDYGRFPLGPPMAGSCCDPLSLGYVYIISFDNCGMVKIGSSVSVGLRMDELQCGNPYKLHLHYAVSIYEGCRVKVERLAHRLAKDCHYRGEWYRLSPDAALEVVLKAARNQKAKFGAQAVAYESTMRQPIDREAEESERRRLLRIKLGMEDA